MRRFLEDAQSRPRMMAQELGGVPAGGGIVQSAPSFNPDAAVQQVVPQQSGGGLGDLVGMGSQILQQKRLQDRADYGKVNVDWNAQSDLNRGRMADMYAAELAAPTGILPAGNSGTTMIKPQGSGGFVNALKGLFGGGA